MKIAIGSSVFLGECQNADAKSGKKILLLEDDPTLVRLLTEFLEDQGHSVTATDDAREALNIIDSEAWDLIITDGALKDSCGEDFAAQVAARKLEIPVVLVTGSIRVLKDRSLFQGVLRKPFTRSDFLRFIHEAMPSAAAAVTSSAEKAA